MPHIKRTIGKTEAMALIVALSPDDPEEAHQWRDSILIAYIRKHAPELADLVEAEEERVGDWYA